MNDSLLLPYVLYVIYYYVLSNTNQAEHSACVFKGFYRLRFSREAIASHSFGAYMGVRTCSHKTIYATKELPKARKPQPVCGVRFLSKPCLKIRAKEAGVFTRLCFLHLKRLSILIPKKSVGQGHRQCVRT